MKAHNSLEAYKLVKSLTIAEKATFKKGLRKRVDGKLSKVFDILNSANEFDEAVLDTKISKTYANVPDAYRNIISAVVRGLSQQPSGNSILEMNALINQVEITFQRRLYTLCAKLIGKGLELSLRNERPAHRYQLLHYKWRIPLDSFQPPETDHIGTFDALDLCIKEMTVRERFDRMAQLILNIRTSGITHSSRNELEQKTLQNQNSELENLDRFGSKQLEQKGPTIVAFSYWVCGHWEQSVAVMEKMLNSDQRPEEMSLPVFDFWLRNAGNLMGQLVMVDRRDDHLKLRQRVLAEVQKKGCLDF